MSERQPLKIPDRLPILKKIDGIRRVCRATKTYTMAPSKTRFSAGDLVASLLAVTVLSPIATVVLLFIIHWLIPSAGLSRWSAIWTFSALTLPCYYWLIKNRGPWLADWHREDQTLASMA